ncbi:hypothetical protein [Streptomyces sp. NPDC093094]|uniref:hypothetical protein n=1 Tax=Streptomyces sp. NPDC093094 TaxID=3366026 RepID=UPI00381EACCD
MRSDHEPQFGNDLPDPQDTLTRTDWAGLQHAYGPAIEAPQTLVALLDPDQAVRTRALNNLHDVLHHQNTLYEATPPTALYVSAILPDTRTLRPIDKDYRVTSDCMRAELLLWIASVANEVTDAADAMGQEHGFPLDEYPPAVAVREIRPLLFTAAFAYAHDADRSVAEAALLACIPLLDDPRLLRHRAALVPAIRQVLGTSGRWQHRERAIDALNAWGENSSGLQGQRNPFLFCDTDLPPDSSPQGSDAATIQGCGEEPPF